MIKVAEYGSIKKTEQKVYTNAPFRDASVVWNKLIVSN